MKRIVRDIKHQRALCLVLVVILAVTLFISGCASNGAKKDLEVLEASLLDPSSLVVYKAYYAENYGKNGSATLFYFGARNKLGGISDDWALVYDGHILFETNYKIANSKGDNSGVLEHGELVFAKFSINMGADGWEEIDIK